MNPPRNDLLLLAGKVLTLLIQGAMVVAAGTIVITIPLVVIFQDSIDNGIALEYGSDTLGIPLVPVIGLLAVVLVLVSQVFVFFGKLRGIIDTVADGDPFVPENADRLNAMAWLQIGIYLAGLVAASVAVLVIVWAEQFTEIEIDGSLEVDIPSVMLIVTLFILARVFRQGAAMRADLEGTV